jgi:hypothetical protein
LWPLVAFVSGYALRAGEAERAFGTAWAWVSGVTVVAVLAAHASWPHRACESLDALVALWASWPGRPLDALRAVVAVFPINSGYALTAL